MARFVQGRDGKLAGSIGDGKYRIPTASPVPLLETAGAPAQPYALMEDRYGQYQAKTAAEATAPPPPEDLDGAPDTAGEDLGEQILAEYQAASPRDRRGLMGRLTPEGSTYRQALVEFSATVKGRRKIEALKDDLANAGFGQRDPQAVATLTSVLKSSVARAAERKDEDRKAANAREREKRAQRRAEGRDPTHDYRAQQPAPQVLAGKVPSLASLHPELATEWHPDNPCTPEQVSGNGGPVAALWKCRTCGHVWHTQVGNRLQHFKARRTYSRCPQCANRMRFRQSQDRLKDLIARYQANPEAFDQLPPAIKESILIRMGILGSGDSTFAPVGNALVRGDVSLQDVLNATDADSVMSRIDFDATDRDDADRELTDEELARLTAVAAVDDTRTTGQKVDTILATGEYATLVDDPAIVEQIVQSGVRGLWDEVHNNPTQVDAILARVDEQAGTDHPSAVIAGEFARQVRAAQEFNLPDGYNAIRVDEKGDDYELRPFLSQTMFALEVEKRRRVANLSGTGAGKTVSAILAARHIGAKETVMFVPASVTRQWSREVTAAFPDTDVRIGLPESGEDLAATFTGKPRVWIVSYGELSAHAEESEAPLRNLSKRTDMIVLDEAHKVKTRDKTVTSKRRAVLEKFARDSTRNNEDLAVVAMTATPVVNDLEEAASLVRIVSGSKTAGFGVKPTKANALAAHRVVSGHSIRFTPAYLANVDRVDAVVRLDGNAMRSVAAEYARLAEGRPQAAGHPAMVERALLPAKLPALVDTVRRVDGPTVVYSHYTTGMVDTTVNRLRAEGVTAERLTGAETPTQREAILKQFQRGEVKVLVASQAVSTGVDGLQDVCHNLVILSPPWTAADEEQLVGRLNRTGQTRKVKVHNIIAEADLGNGETWSYDRGRYQGLHFKRGLADAVTSGVIPQGHVASDAVLSKRAATTLLDFFQRTGRQLDSDAG